MPLIKISLIKFGLIEIVAGYLLHVRMLNTIVLIPVASVMMAESRCEAPSL